MRMKEKYLSIDEQICKLRERKLVIPDEAHAKSVLFANNYSSFIRYYGPPFLYNSQQEDSDYITGASFEEIYNLCVFNQKIRALFLEYLLIVEHTLKSVIADYFARELGPIAYWDSNNFSEKSRAKRTDQKKRSTAAGPH